MMFQQTLSRAFAWLVCALAAGSAFAQTASSPRLRDGVGGGFTRGGLNGEYFPNANWSGGAAFPRRDVRIAFDWGLFERPGGSRSTGFSAVGTDNYSIRWTGQLIPRFTETYRFEAVARHSFVLEVKRAADPSYTTVISLAPGAEKGVGSLPLIAGEKYDVRIRYSHTTGTARAHLYWSSPSTPHELIGPAAQSSVNVNTYFANLWASASDAGRSTWEGLSRWDLGTGGVDRPAPAMDANGYPTSQWFGLIIHEIFGDRIQPMMRGRMRMTFNGRSAYLLTRGNLTFADGTTEKEGAQFYDAATNTTTVDLQGVDRGWNIAQISFSGAFRTNAQGAAPGITNLKIMMPTDVDGTVTLGSGNIFHPKAMEAFSRFTALRINMNTNNREVVWANRTPPTFFSQGGGKINRCPVFGPGSDNPGFWDINSGMSWEHQIMFCNQTGKDMHISLPHLVDDDYVLRVARMIRFGSDGVNPYTSVQANPVYPPLNSSLKVYVELGNELWNWGSVRDYPAYHTWRQTIINELQANAPNARIYNFDNLSTAIDGNGWPTEYMNFFHRRTLLRTYQLSEIFRSVYGSGNMMFKIRPLMFGWYNNIFNVQERIYSFADNYFNNATGSHVPNANWNQAARPMNSYIYGGGGGAHYFGSGNGNGFTDILTQGSFEAPAVPQGYSLRPTTGAWTFTGPAGIARSGSVAEIPPGYQGAQVMYLSREAGVRGTASLTFTMPGNANQVSPVHGLALRVVSRRRTGSSGPDAGAFRIFVNNVEVTQANDWMDDGTGTWTQVGQIPLGWDSGAPWYTRQGWFYADLHLFTRHFELTGGSPVTIRIENTSPLDGQMMYFDDLRLTSVDAIFNGGIPGAGQAFGQVTSGTYDFELFGQSNWAHAYGLEYVTYEGGWSLGGDNGGSYVQNWAKFKDPRARQTNIDSLRSFFRSGGFLPTFGTYNQWPGFSNQFWEEGMVNTSQYPLAQGIDDALDRLPAEGENGSSIPSFLSPSQATLVMPTNTPNPAAPIAGGWIGWNVVAARTGLYQVTANTTPGGTGRLVVNGRTVAQGAAGTLSASLWLARGVHNIRVQATTSGFTINGVTVSMPRAPLSPTITGIVEASGSATVQWARMKGPDGFVIRYGTQPDRLNQVADVGSATSHTITGLVHGSTYYVEVLAYNAFGLSQPSARRAIIALVDGQQGALGIWDFAGVGQTVGALPPTGATSRVSFSNLTRGSGYRDPDDSWANCYQVYPAAGDDWPSTMANALSSGAFIEFTLTPQGTTRASLDQLSVWAAAQRATSGGVGLSYRIGSGAFSAPVSMGTFQGFDERRRFTLSLSGIAALQNLNQAVTFRVFIYGNERFNWGFFGLDSDSPTNRVTPENQPDIELRGRLATSP